MTRYNRNKPIKRNRKGKKYYRGAKQKWLSRVPLPRPFYNTYLCEMRSTPAAITLSPTQNVYTCNADMKWTNNSLYNTFTGNEKAYGLDLLNDLYSHWTVVRAHLDLRIMGNNTAGAQVCVSHTATSVPGWSNIQDQAESPSTKTKMVCQDKPFRMGMTVDIAKQFGLTPKQCSYKHDLIGTGLTPPNDLQYFIVALQSITTASFWLVPTITFTVIWTERFARLIEE